MNNLYHDRTLKSRERDNKEEEWKKWSFALAAIIALSISFWIWYTYVAENKDNKEKLENYTKIHDDLSKISKLDSWSLISHDDLRYFAAIVHKVTNSNLNVDQKKLLKSQIDQIIKKHPNLVENPSD